MRRSGVRISNGEAPAQGPPKARHVWNSFHHRRPPLQRRRQARRRSGQLESEAEESRRLLALKDQELQALRNRISQLEKQGGEVAVEEPPATGAGRPAAAELRHSRPLRPPRNPHHPRHPRQNLPRRRHPPSRSGPSPPKATGSGILGAIGGLLTSAWFWIPALIVLIRRLAHRPRGGRPVRTGRHGVRRRPAATRMKNPHRPWRAGALPKT